MKKIKFLLLILLMITIITACTIESEFSEMMETPTGQLISKSTANEAYLLSDEAKSIYKKIISTSRDISIDEVDINNTIWTAEEKEAIEKQWITLLIENFGDEAEKLYGKTEYSSKKNMNPEYSARWTSLLGTDTKYVSRHGDYDYYHFIGWSQESWPWAVQDTASTHMEIRNIHSGTWYTYYSTSSVWLRLIDDVSDIQQSTTTSHIISVTGNMKCGFFPTMSSFQFNTLIFYIYSGLRSTSFNKVVQ